MRILILSALYFVPVLVVGCLSRSTSEPIVVGHVVPLSGENEQAGKQAKNAVLLAVEEVNKSEEKIHGRKVAVRHLDCRGSAEVAHADTVRLVTLNRVPVILGGIDAAQVEKMGQGAKPDKIAVVGSVGISPRARDNLVFSTAPTPAQQGQVLARFLKDGMPERVTTVFLVHDSTSSYARDLVDAFVQELKGAIAVERVGIKAETDLSSVQKEMQDAKPGAVLMVGCSVETVKKLRGRDPETPGPLRLYGGEEGQIAALQASVGVCRDMYWATPFAMEKCSNIGTEFVKLYKERFEEEPTIHAILAYENARLLFEAMRKTRSHTAGRIHDELLALDKFDSVMGSITFNKEHLVQRPLFIMQMKDGQPKIVKRDPAESGE